MIEKSRTEALSTAEVVLLQKLDLAELHQFELARDLSIDLIKKWLNDHERWLTHGRGIDMRTLREELRLKIKDFGTTPDLKKAIWDYFWFLRDHMARNRLVSFVHTPYYF